MKTNEQGRSPGRPSAFHRGVLFTGSGTSINIALLFIETLIAVRLLPPASYGVYVLLVAVANFAVVTVDFGCKTAVTQMIARGGGTRQAALANDAMLFRLVAVVALSGLTWLGRDLLLILDPSGDLGQYIVYVPFLFAAASFDELLTAVLQGFQAYRHMAIAQISRSVLRLCMSAMLLGVFKLGVMALVYSWLLSFVVSIAYQYTVLPISKRVVFDRPLLSEMLRFGRPLQGNRFLWFVFGRVNVLLIGSLAGPASVAYYEVAARIPEALQRLSESYLAVYFPTVTNLLANGKKREAVWILNHSLRLISFATALLALFVVLFGEQIIVLLFSDKYTVSSLAFALLMIAFHMTFIGNVMGYTLTAAGRPGRSFVHGLVRTLLLTVGDLLSIPVLGFLGPAFATLLSVYAANPIAVWLLRRSSLAVVVAPFVKQTTLLLAIAGLFWWAHPTELIYKGAIFLLFVALSALLSTISVDDLSLVLPKGILKRPVAEKGFLPYGN